MVYTNIKNLEVGLKNLRQTLGTKIVFTNGCFDILHAGHVFCLTEAKKLGEILVVGINSDRSVRANKGQNRPIFNENRRVNFVSSLECVDAVILFDEDTPYKIIETIKPQVLVKGGDWKEEKIVGADFVKSYGGRVVTIQHELVISTSDIINRIVARFCNG